MASTLPPCLAEREGLADLGSAIVTLSAELAKALPLAPK